MTDAPLKTPHVVAIASVILCARMFAADPDLATLEPRLTQIASAAPGEVGVSLFHVDLPNLRDARPER